MSNLIHIVLFKFEEDAPKATVHSLCTRFVGLKDACKHPSTNEPYIISARGGKDNPLDGLAAGHTHGFVLEFANAADRDYYVHEDPAHLEFKDDVGKVLGGATVVDFEPGVTDPQDANGQTSSSADFGKAVDRGVVHIVLFKYKDSASTQDVSSICQRYLSLRQNCDRAGSTQQQQPYIKRLLGGRDNSPEGMQNGMEYGFVVEFDNVEDCKYYIHEDPVHVKFKEDATPFVTGAMKLDFEPGIF